ncbi:MAG: DoxX family membrane protein, partial [Gallionella sp.]
MGAKAMAQAMGKPQMAGFLTFLGFAETAGALAMFSGFLTQLAALGLGIIMVGAIGLKVAMMKAPFTSHDKVGWDFDFIILA